MKLSPEPRRLLVFARDAIGDLINTTGALHALREAYPHAEMVVEGGALLPKLWTETPAWIRPRGGIVTKVRRVLRMRRGRFDAAIIFDNSHDAARLARRAAIPIVLGAHKGKPELFTRSIAYDPSGHDMFPILEGVLGLVGAGPYPGPILPTPVPARLKRGIGLHITASDVAKEWPTTHWIELARRLIGSGEEVWLLVGPGQEARLAEASRNLPGARIQPPQSLLDYADFIAGLEALVVADTGPAHLAAAVDTFVVVLYGPTPPRRGHPWGANFAALYVPNACEHYGRGCCQRVSGACPQACMAAISPDRVEDALTARHNRT